MTSYDIEGLDLDLQPRVTVWYEEPDGSKYRESLVFPAGRAPVSYITPWPKRSLADVLANLQS